jgi:hypothetical protein
MIVELLNKANWLLMWLISLLIRMKLLVDIGIQFFAKIQVIK